MVPLRAAGRLDRLIATQSRRDARAAGRTLTVSRPVNLAYLAHAVDVTGAVADVEGYRAGLAWLRAGTPGATPAVAALIGRALDTAPADFAAAIVGVLAALAAEYAAGRPVPRGHPLRASLANRTDRYAAGRA